MTLFAEMSPSIHTKHTHTRIKTQTFMTTNYVQMSWCISREHTLFICGTFLLVVKWPCCHSSLPLIPWGWTQRKGREWRMKRKTVRRKCLKLQIHDRGKSLILRWGINETSTGYDNTVSGCEELYGPVGSYSY